MGGRVVYCSKEERWEGRFVNCLNGLEGKKGCLYSAQMVVKGGEVRGGEAPGGVYIIRIVEIVKRGGGDYVI